MINIEIQVEIKAKSISTISMDLHKDLVGDEFIL